MNFVPHNEKTLKLGEGIEPGGCNSFRFKLYHLIRFIPAYA